MTDYRFPRYVYPPPSSASMSTLPNTPPHAPPPARRGDTILDAIGRSDSLTAWALLRDWHDADPCAAQKWRNTLTMALSLLDRIETAP